MKRKTLYLAYGSNLHKATMLQRCPSAKAVGKRFVSHARLVFRGVADLAYEPGHLALAGLWEIDREDEAVLDRYEGTPTMYGRYWVPIKYKGRQCKALLYLMNDRGIFPPSAYYVQTLRRGYKDFGFDESYLNDAIAHSFESKAPTEQTKKRRERQINSTNQRWLVKMPEAVALARLDAQRKLAHELLKEGGGA